MSKETVVALDHAKFGALLAFTVEKITGRTFSEQVLVRKLIGAGHGKNSIWKRP